MANLAQTHYNLKFLDELSRKGTGFQRIHPVFQITVAFSFILVTISFAPFELGRLLPMLLYPLVVFVVSDIPVKPVLFRLLFALPVILGIGIFNPILDNQIVSIGAVTLSRGWLTFFSLLLKGGLTVVAAILLLSTCGLPRIAHGLRLLKVPRLLVMQLLLTYRYLTVLIEEVARTLAAYEFRAPDHRGVRYKAWGSLAGQLLLRTFDRAERIYQAMRLRGFEGDFPNQPLNRIDSKDLIYGVLWIAYFVMIRLFNIPQLLGGLL